MIGSPAEYVMLLVLRQSCQTLQDRADYLNKQRHSRSGGSNASTAQFGADADRACKSVAVAS